MAVKEGKKTFACELCEFAVPYDDFGKTTTMSKSLVFFEDCYIGKDPFSATVRPIAVGGHCTLCRKAVCQSCSIYYTKRFCIPCVQDNLEEFPIEMQEDITKHIRTNKT